MAAWASAVPQSAASATATFSVLLAFITGLPSRRRVRAQARLASDW